VDAKASVLARFGVTPPSNNGLSNANMDRSSDFAERLFWSVLGHLQHASPDFAAGRKGKGLLRRVESWVEVDGKWRTMVSITNNLAWSPRSVCDLYRRRWDIEVFFKQVKQSLKLGSFLGHSANAVRWQIFTALLIYVLLRFMAHLSEWGHGFTRLFTVTRSALWERIDLLGLLKSYGTASGRFKVLGALNTAWLAGFSPAKT
jgi:IS4 transposase